MGSRDEKDEAGFRALKEMAPYMADADTRVRKWAFLAPLFLGVAHIQRQWARATKEQVCVAAVCVAVLAWFALKELAQL